MGVALRDDLVFQAQVQICRLPWVRRFQKEKVLLFGRGALRRWRQMKSNCSLAYRETRTVHSARRGILLGPCAPRRSPNGMAHTIGPGLGQSGCAQNWNGSRKRWWKRATVGDRRQPMDEALFAFASSPKRAQVRTNERLTSRGDRTCFFNIVSDFAGFAARVLALQTTVLAGLLYLLCDML